MLGFEPNWFFSICTQHSPLNLFHIIFEWFTFWFIISNPVLTFWTWTLKTVKIYSMNIGTGCDVMRCNAMQCNLSMNVCFAAKANEKKPSFQGNCMQFMRIYWNSWVLISICSMNRRCSFFFHWFKLFFTRSIPLSHTLSFISNVCIASNSNRYYADT